MIIGSHRVRALGFDVFGTVVDWREGIARALEPFLRAHGRDDDPRAVADAWRARYQPAMDVVRRGERAWVPLSTINRENLENVLGDLGIDLARIDPEAIAHLARAWERLDPWPDAVAGLERLRRRFTIVTLSNGDVATMAALARFGGLPWDGILGAESTRSYKPDPHTYLGTADALGLAPGECAMVAAHDYDLVAARGCGFGTIFVPRPREYGPAQTTDLGPTATWDVVATDLVDLAEHLEC